MEDKKVIDVKGTHGTCETVRVKADNESGYMVINQSDFDPGVHEEYWGEEKTKTAEREDFSSLTKAELRERLTDAGVEYDQEANKADLIELAVAHLSPR
jgi:hypothetical protein